MRAKHYDAVRQARLYMLEVIRQAEHTNEIRSAWAAAHATLAGLMEAAAWARRSWLDPNP